MFMISFLIIFYVLLFFLSRRKKFFKNTKKKIEIKMCYLRKTFFLKNKKIRRFSLQIFKKGEEIS